MYVCMYVCGSLCAILEGVSRGVRCLLPAAAQRHAVRPVQAPHQHRSSSVCIYMYVRVCMNVCSCVCSNICMYGV